MIALVVQGDPYRAASTTAGLMRLGYQVITVESLRAAEAMSQLGVLDVLIVEERVQGDLTHKLILSAERRNPGVTAIMLTAKTGEASDELYLLLPALYAQLPLTADAATVSKFVHAGVAYSGDQLHRSLERVDDISIRTDPPPVAESNPPAPAMETLSRIAAMAAPTPLPEVTRSAPPVAVDRRSGAVENAPLAAIEDIGTPNPALAPFQSIRTPVMH